MVPNKLVGTILTAYHDECGHFRYRKTFAMIAENYVWGQMQTDT